MVIRSGRSVLPLIMAAVVVGFAGSGCGSGDGDCEPEPADAIRGYENVAPEIETGLRDVLFRRAYAVLAAGAAREVRDAGVEQVRQRLDAEGVDPTTMTDLEFLNLPGIGQLRRETAGQGALARQAAAVLEQVTAAVREHAALLPLPDDEMLGWRDDLRPAVQDALVSALANDPTYRAGMEVIEPDWDGSLESLRALPDNQDIVNSIGSSVLRGVQNSLVAACRA